MLGVLYIIGCPVQLIGEVFSRLHSSVVVDTHLPRFEALAYVLPLFDALTHVVIRVSSAFIFQTFAEVCYSVFVNRSSFKNHSHFVKRTYLRVCWRSTIDLCLMNLPKRSSFKSVLKVNTLSKILLWIIPSYFSLENACYSWYVHQTGLFSSASVVPQSKFTGELWSSASVVPQSKSTEMCSYAAVPQSKFTGELCSSAAVIPQSKSSEMWSSAAPFHHDLWYFRHWTNEHFSSMLFIRKNVSSPQ